MEKEGYVSLWIGNIKSDDELMAYVELEYTDDGDCIPSKFLKLNSAILLYNFDFDEKIDRVNTSQYTFTFICSVKYK